ncbi:MAG: hypothetical protein JXB19_04735 [Bacteroidales bacterium]|nr:hypothetical protein [Bacteroidales bacterium]
MKEYFDLQRFEYSKYVNEKYLEVLRHKVNVWSNESVLPTITAEHARQLCISGTWYMHQVYLSITKKRREDLLQKYPDVMLKPENQEYTREYFEKKLMQGLSPDLQEVVNKAPQHPFRGIISIDFYQFADDASPSLKPDYEELLKARCTYQLDTGLQRMYAEVIPAYFEAVQKVELMIRKYDLKKPLQPFAAVPDSFLIMDHPYGKQRLVMGINTVHLEPALPKPEIGLQKTGHLNAKWGDLSEEESLRIFGPADKKEEKLLVEYNKKAKTKKPSK